MKVYENGVPSVLLSFFIYIIYIFSIINKKYIIIIVILTPNKEISNEIPENKKGQDKYSPVLSCPVLSSSFLMLFI
jgi:hypothetical protein